jgi:hypothetical protein
VITKLSIPQEGDTSEITCKTIEDIGKPTTVSSVVSKVIEATIKEGQNLRDVDPK